MKQLKYKKCVVIVHGKSELHLTKYIYTNLHLPVVTYSEQNGNKSIQINGLKGLLSKKQFKSLAAFANNFTVEYDSKGKKLKDFTLFIVMDTDDCDEKTKQDYISGKLFEGMALAPYIVPIFNSDNLEDVLSRTKLMPKRIKEKDKEKYYSKVFPINKEKLSTETIDQVKTLLNELKGVKGTNLPVMINHFLKMLENKS